MTTICIFARNNYFCAIMTNREFTERLSDLYRKYAGKGLVNFVERIFTFDYRYDEGNDKEEEYEYQFISGMRDDVDDLLKIVRTESVEHACLLEMKNLFDERIITIIRDIHIR